MADLYWRGSSFGNIPASRVPSVLSLILYLFAIVACGGFGALVGWAVAGGIGLEGTPMALVAALVAMLVAAIAWVAGAALLSRRR
ncbi:hypothetical protein BURK1_00406 [Burkholderiales bacterium]|nr:hypothetical protein BURK1_00406 [Burkholderiales bacterium]